jgi:hypothetical protein
MALDQSALLEILEVLKVAYVGDRVRTAAETIYEALIEAELTETIGAAPHERSETVPTCATGTGVLSLHRRSAARVREGAMVPHRHPETTGLPLHRLHPA